MNPDWIAVDWGTSNLRAWAIEDSGDISASAKSDRGMARLKPSEFEPALLSLTKSWLHPDHRTDVIISGMAGAKTGWEEAPYLDAPCEPLSPSEAVSPRVHSTSVSVTILPGVKTGRPVHDVMRGEETQLAGLLEMEPGFAGVVCLPGTHTKWVHLENGLIVSFQTFMSGELFDLLANRSTLSSCVADGGWESEEFKDAVESGLRQPASLSGLLFGIRAESLVAGLSPSRAAARLSGLIVGTELAASKPFWLGRNTVIIGSGQVSEAYSLSLQMQGLEPRIVDVTAATVEGLKAFRRRQRMSA